MKRFLKKLFKYVGITILVLIISAGTALFLFRDSDMATAFLKEQAISAAAKAGYQLSIEELKGNPLRGYQVKDMSISAKNALDVNIEILRIELSYSSLLKGKPLEPILIKNGTIDIIDPSKLPGGKSEKKKGKVWFPHIPVQIRDLTLKNKEMLKDFTIASADIGISPEDLSVLLKGYIEEKKIESNIALKMSKDELFLSRFELTFDSRGKIKAEGNVLPDFGVEGTVASLDLGSIASILPDRKSPEIAGIVNFYFSLAGTPGDPLFKGDLSVAGPGFQSYRINSVKSSISFDGSLLSVTDLKADMLGSTLSADLSFWKDGKIDASFFAKALDLSRLEKMDTKLPQAKGTIEKIEGKVSGDPTNLRGNISARSSSLSLMDQEITDTVLDVEFEGTTVNINSSLHWKGEPVSTRGTVLLGPDPTIEMLTSVNNFDIANIRSFLDTRTAEFVPQGKFDLTARINGPVRDPSVKLDINSPSLDFKDEKITSLKADLVFKKPDLQINDLSCVLPEGSLSGSGLIALDKSNRTDVNLRTVTRDISRTLKLVPSTPEGISGEAETLISVTGKIDDPDVKGSFNTRDFSFQSLFQAEQVEGNFSFRNNRLNLVISSPVALLDRMLANNLNAELGWQPGKLYLRKGSAELLGGKFSSSGEVLLSRDAQLDLSGSFERLALEKLPWQIPVDIQGETYGEFSLSGTVKDPVIAFELNSPNLLTEGTTLDNIIINADLRNQTFSLKSIFAQIGRGQVQGNASVDLADNFRTEFNLEGKRLDLPYMLRNMEGDLGNLIDGSMDVSASGTFASGAIRAEALISSESIMIQGFEIRDILCPVMVNSPNIEIPSLTASIYGGNLQSGSEINMDTLEWESSSILTSMDLGSMAESMEDLPLTMTGTVEGKVKIHGRGGDRFSIFGTGDVTARDGDIGGLPAIKAAAATGGKESLSFRRARSNFLVDGFGVTILAGSRVEAPLKDPLYQHLAIDGLIEYDGGLDIEGNTVVNLQAMNAFLGGLQTALRATLSKGNLLEDITGGLLGRVSKKDYREVIFHIEGTRDAPELSKLEVQGGEQYISDLINLDEFNEQNMERDEKQIQIRINFPVGKGGEKESPSAGEQFKDQLIEGILKGISPAK